MPGPWRSAPHAAPIDADAIVASVGKTGAAVACEEHSIIGGLGSAVAEVLGEMRPAPLERIGVRAEASGNETLANQVRAVKDGDSYVLNGQKSSWVSNGTFAKYAALWLSIDPSRGNEGGGIAVIPLDLPGISRGKPLDKIGQRALNQAELFFDDVHIPAKAMVAADPVTYKTYSNVQLGLANGLMGLLFAGCAQSALEESLEYAKQRVQGGRPIFEHQNIRLKLFDMFTSVEAARSLARRALIYNHSLYKQMQPMAVQYAMAAKIMSTETAFRVASEGVQIFGGYGFMRGYLVERLYRDNRILSIGGGTTEIMKEIISRFSFCNGSG
mgnify:CR=1 FL=1